MLEASEVIGGAEVEAARSGGARAGVGHCDRTTSEMRGLSPKIRTGDSQRSENT
jgi:hypothetical protein